ncbi:MAG TPA: TIGR01777 family oxidoreductase [Acidobacteriota bacterium]|nr:TIGR01777 family oxidoreductase [Acidobacteriota bacterium]
MRILVSGASGLIGSALLPHLAARGHETSRLVRASSKARVAGVVWDPSAGVLDATSLEGFDAVVHLAGENIAGGRWTADKKRKILESRSKGTQLLGGTLSRLAQPPRVLVSASAIGFYGDRGPDVMREDSPPGKGFLPEVCTAWEAATRPAALKGIRVVTLRIGIVLSTAGGALKQMLPPFRLGLGGKIGSGRQFMSWITLDDLVGVLHHSIENDSLSGAVNAVAPNPVTNIEFTRTLGHTLSRPTILPLPAFAARLVLGEMADELLLSSTRVEPAKLIAADFHFEHSELEPALRHVLS